jgi:hypothetical protein
VQRDPYPSDSLAGSLLGRGQEPPQRSGTTQTVVILLAVLGIMILGGLAVAFFAQDVINNSFGAG